MPKLILLACMTLSLPPLQAQTAVFNRNISVTEQERLEAGETVIRKLDSAKELCIQQDCQPVQRMLAVLSVLKPVYIAEIIKVYPYAGNEQLDIRFQERILEIGSYAGIPYYSEHAGEWYELYSSARIVSEQAEKNAGNKELRHMTAELEMEPFGMIETRIDTEAEAGQFYYESTNMNRLRYNDTFTCVQPQKMKSLITVFRDGDRWILYGVGAVHAPDVFFLRKRIETSFMNRIKTFCSYFFTNF